MGTGQWAMLQVTVYPVAAILLGGAVAAWRAPSEKARSVIQHFAAGVVLAAVAGELLPEITKQHLPLGVLIGFVLGIGLMVGVKTFIARINQGEGSPKANLGLLLSVAIDVFVDGLLIGVGFAAGARIGKLLVVALTLELLFLGLSAVASMASTGWPRQRILMAVAGLGALVAAGAFAGMSLLAGLSGLALQVTLSFGAAALLYLVLEELLAEAHRVKETPFITASLFAGFVALYLLQWTV